MNVKDELKYGFWMAFVLFTWWVVEYLVGFQTVHIEYLMITINVSSIAVLFSGLYLALNNARSKLSRKGLTFGSLFISGGVALMACSILVYGLSIMFYKVVNPGWTATITEIKLTMASSELSTEDLALKKEQLMAQYSPMSMGMQSFFRMIFFGLLILLVQSFAVFKSGKTA